MDNPAGVRVFVHMPLLSRRSCLCLRYLDIGSIEQIVWLGIIERSIPF